VWKVMGQIYPPQEKKKKTTREKIVITYEHLKDEKTISSRIGYVEDYYYLKGS